MDQALAGSGMVSTLQKFRQLRACTLLLLSSTLVYHKNLSIRKEKKISWKKCYSILKLVILMFPVYTRSVLVLYSRMNSSNSSMSVT